jgi:hypothetical protein
MLRAAIRQEETASDGTTSTSDFTALYHGEHLENARLELSQGGISLVVNGASSWAARRGQLDTRALAPRMAAGNLRQILFPLLMPFSLQMIGIVPGAVSEETFDGEPVWAIEIDFEKDFFVTPSMDTTWRVFVNRENHQVLGAEFLPPEEYREVRDEGVRYRVLKRDPVDGLMLPSQVLLDGIDFNGVENGHVRVTKIETTTIGPFDLSIFIHPDELERIEADDIE